MISIEQFLIDRIPDRDCLHASELDTAIDVYIDPAFEEAETLFDKSEDWSELSKELDKLYEEYCLEYKPYFRR
jgi:hypothetical protein